MADLIERLRAFEGSDELGNGDFSLLSEAAAEIERLRKLHQDAYQRGHQSGSRGLREAYDAIQEVKRQDAWGNAQLTEALLAAEERAERMAEALREAEKLLKRTPKVTRHMYVGADPIGWGVQAGNVLAMIRAALAKEDRND